MATATAQENAGHKIPVTYKTKAGDRKKRISRSDSYEETLERIRPLFSLADDTPLKLRAKIGRDEFDVENQDDADEFLPETEELIVMPAEVLESVESPSYGRDDEKLVRIDGEEFRIDAFPRSPTKLVDEQRRTLLHHLNVPALVSEFHEVRTFLYIAYLGTGHTPEVQNQVHEVGFTVAKLCEKSKQTLLTMTTNSLQIVEKLQDAFRYLLDGRDGMTSLNFKDIDGISKRMVTEIDELKTSFDEGVNEAKEALQRAQAERVQRNEELSRDHEKRLQVTQNKEIREKEVSNMEELGEQLKEEIHEKRNLYDKATELTKRPEASKWKAATTALNDLVGMHTAENDAAARGKELNEVIEQRREVTTRKVKATELLTKCAHDLENLEERKGDIEPVLEALHAAITGLKGLSDILFRACTVFASLSHLMDDIIIRCGSLKEKMSAGSTLQDLTLREQLLKSETFKVEAVRCMSRWIAVGEICSSQKEEMEKVTGELHSFLRENPTKEEAKLAVELERQLRLSKADSHDSSDRFPGLLRPLSEPAFNGKDMQASQHQGQLFQPSGYHCTNRSDQEPRPGLSRAMSVSTLDQRDAPSSGLRRPSVPPIEVYHAARSDVPRLPRAQSAVDLSQGRREVPGQVFTNLYVKHISSDVDDDELERIFKSFGPIVRARVQVDDDGRSKLFGFVNFATPQAARDAVWAMDGMMIDGKLLYVQPHQSKAQRWQELRERYKPCEGSNVYIKNLEPVIDDDRLKLEFSPFGTITSAKVEKDRFGNSKGFGFVCYSSSEEANEAIIEMNGQIIEHLPLYVTLAQRKEDRQRQLAAAYGPGRLHPGYQISDDDDEEEEEEVALPVSYQQAPSPIRHASAPSIGQRAPAPAGGVAPATRMPGPRAPYRYSMPTIRHPVIQWPPK